MKIKKIVSITLAALAAIVLVWGIVASVLVFVYNTTGSNRVMYAQSTANTGAPSTSHSYDLAKDGRILVTNKEMPGTLKADQYDALSADAKATYDEQKAVYEKIYVFSLDSEYITRSEFYARDIKAAQIYKDVYLAYTLKNAQKALDAAPETGKDAATDAVNAIKRQIAKAENDIASKKNDKRNTEAQYFTSSSSTFFATYLPTAALLLIAFFINQKLEYGKKENNA